MDVNNTVKKAGAWVSFVVGFNAFLKQIWKYIALILAGVVAGLVYAMKQEQPDQTNNISGDYIKDQSQDIKIKQKGEGNTMDVSELSGKEKRLARRAKRRERRAQKEMDELELKDTGV